jgi:release factor glutamine methyltransferase
VDEATLEADLMLMKALDVDRPRLYASPERVTTPEEREVVSRDVTRRLAGDPWPYISGHREFYGMDMAVGPGVFIPRPETELLVDLALEVANAFPSDRQLRIADVCTGSGAIAVALAARLPQATVYATDISAFALEATRLNSERYGLQDRLVLGMGSLLDPVPAQVDIVVSNPPYIPRKDIPHLEREVLAEPLEALDGGEDGLDMVKDLIIQALAKLRRPGALIVEISPVQASEVLHLAQSTFPQAECSIHKDLAGRERALLAKAP